MSCLPELRVRLPLFLGALLVFGCDSTPSAEQSAAPATAQSIAIALEGRPNGDYFYDLAPLDVRERFEATLVGSAGALRLQFEGTGGGRGVIELVNDEKRPSESVSLDYITDGVVIASRAFDGGDRDVYQAGTADREPDSVHYIWYQDGSVEIRYDYYDKEGSGAATVTSVDGELHTVTDVRFVIEDADIGVPEKLALTSASALTLR